jgi:hypothetical protein
MRAPRALAGLAILTAALASGCCPSGDAADHDPAVTWGGKVRGGWLARWGEEPWTGAGTQAELARLRALGVEWIAYAPDVQMADITRPAIEIPDDAAACREILRFLKEAGFKVFLMPRIESPDFFRAQAPTWRGDIAMRDADDWTKFHDELEAMTLHYARIAQEESVDLFGLGLEYRHSAANFPERWRRLAAAVRAVYGGKITYSANWDEEYEEIEFWDALDFIGVGAYFPLTDDADDGAAEWEDGWRRIKRSLRELSRRFDRRVLFTETGFPAYADAAVRPWEWTRSAGKVVHEGRQADCYRSFFATFASVPWFEGAFLWRFYNVRGRAGAWDYAPQGKAAEDVLRECWMNPPPSRR